MVKVRQDAWSHEDDLLLAETVLRHIREGSTQLNAFEEVGDKLNRTSAACGFRWNAEIRNKYDSAIDLAKRQRKEKKRATEIVTLQPEKQNHNMIEFEKPETNYNANSQDLTLDAVISYLSKLKVDVNDTNNSKITLKQLKEENDSFQKRIKELESELTRTEAQLQTIQEDYQTFITIMERARKMTVLDEQGSYHTPKFRMDKNGNLEQVSHGPN